MSVLSLYYVRLLNFVFGQHNLKILLENRIIRVKKNNWLQNPYPKTSYFHATGKEYFNLILYMIIELFSLVFVCSLHFKCLVDISIFRCPKSNKFEWNNLDYNELIILILHLATNYLRHRFIMSLREAGSRKGIFVACYLMSCKTMIFN